MMKRRFLALSLIAVVLFAVTIPAMAQQGSDIRGQVPEGLSIYSTAQRFEHGLMLWRSDTGYIWVLADNHQAFQFPASSYGRLPDNPIFGTPPSRLRPIFGFGKVWGNNQQVRDLIGWPIDQELGFNMDIKIRYGAYYLGQLDGTVYQVNPDNSWNYAAESNDNGQPLILGFGIDRTSAAPGDVVTLFWQTRHVELVMIELYDTGRGVQTAFIPDFAANSETTFPIPTNMEGDARFVIWAARKPFPNAIPSQYERLTSVEITLPIQGSAETSISTQASYEKFEHGFMVWRADNQVIYAFYDFGNGGGQVAQFDVSQYRDIAEDLSIAVPPLYARPVNGFGKVWGGFANVRNQIGYALASEYGFSLTVRGNQGQPLIFELPGGERASVSYLGSWWTYSS